MTRRRGSVAPEYFVKSSKPLTSKVLCFSILLHTPSPWPVLYRCAPWTKITITAGLSVTGWLKSLMDGWMGQLDGDQLRSTPSANVEVRPRVLMEEIEAALTTNSVDGSQVMHPTRSMSCRQLVCARAARIRPVSALCRITPDPDPGGPAKRR